MLKGKIIITILLGLCIQYGRAQDTGNAKNIEGSVIWPTKSITDNLAAAPNFSAFYSLIKASDLNFATGTGPFTVLAPPNKAFAKLPPGQLDTLVKPENSIALTTFINNHILQGKVTTASIMLQIKANKGTAILTTAAGTTLIAKINANRNLVLTDAGGNESIISRFDMAVQNGVMHVITGVLETTPLQ